jgi:hypothetical protein
VRIAVPSQWGSGKIRPRPVEPIGRPAGYVKKPFHLDDLMKVVKDALAAA